MAKQTIKERFHERIQANGIAEVNTNKHTPKTWAIYREGVTDALFSLYGHTLPKSDPRNIETANELLMNIWNEHVKEEESNEN